MMMSLKESCLTKWKEIMVAAL